MSGAAREKDSRTPTWRLIKDDVYRDGVRNMALDRALQLEHACGRAPATLRLYGWSGPTVTLGRFQGAEGVDLEVCQREGIGIARRFTGGRGVLHDDELTYSMIAGLHDGVPRGTAASYRHVCSALARAYELLGLETELTRRPRGAASSGACYLHATRADLSVGERKLSGSAQVWHRETLLQHGSFVRSRDVAREARAFRLSPKESAELASTTATLGDYLDPAPDPVQIASAVVNAFEDVMGVDLVVGEPTEREIRTAARLAEQVTVSALG